MNVIFSDKVQQGLENYFQSLAEYPISNERAKEKFANMKSTLLSLGAMPYSNPVCDKKCLGQKFKNRKPVFMNLRYFTYADESKFQWSFSYLIEEKSDTVTVVYMLPSSSVINENLDIMITRYLHEYLSKRLPLAESAQTVVRMNERDLKNMVKHTVKRILNEV